MSIHNGHTPHQKEAIEDDRNFTAFTRSKKPDEWAVEIRRAFKCKIMRAWVASVIWWRWQALKARPALDALVRLMDDYPNSDNPYPLIKIEDAFAKLGGKAHIDKQVKQRDLARMERKPQFPDAPPRGPAERSEPHGKRHYKVRY